MPKPIKVGPKEKPFHQPVLQLAKPPAPADVAVVAAEVPLATEETENSGRVIHRFIVNQGPAGGQVTIAPATPNRRHQVIGFILSATGNGTLQFLSGGPAPAPTTPLTGTMDMGQRNSLVWPSNPSAPFVETNLGDSLRIQTTGGGGVRGMIIYLTV